MRIRRSLSISLVLAVLVAPTVIGCAADSSLEGEGNAASTAAQSSALGVTKLPTGTTIGTYTTDATPDVVETAPFDPSAPVFKETSAGAGWRVVHVKGNLPDAKSGALTAVDDDIIVLESKQAIDGAPLGPKTRAQLKAGSTLRASKAAPSGGDGATTNDDESLFTVIHKKNMDQMENPASAGTATFWSICDDYDGEYTKSLSVDKSYSYHKGDETGSFTGAFDVSARFQGSASATIKYRAKTSVVAACNAVWIDFKKAIVHGNADLTATGKLDAKFQKEWHYKKLIAQPTVFDQWFTIGVVPVHLRLMVPVEAGVDAEAKVTVKANAKVIGHAAFNVTCGSSSCSGSKSATLAFDQTEPPTFEAQARVKVTPWAQVSLKAVLFDETIGGYGQVGVKASLPTDLWAYVGNTCGDADGSGQSELVNGATLDMAAKIDITAKAGAFGGEIGPWTWNVMNKHVWFKSFGEGSTLDPIFTYENTGVLRHVRMHGRMRPCWPYADAVTYRITWSDGSQSDFTGSPTSLFTQDHDFSQYGVKPMKLEAIRDAAGRDLSGAATTHSVYLRPFDVSLPTTGGVVLAP